MSAQGAVDVPLRRRLFASLAVRDYRHFYVGLVFTLTGFWVRLAALTWWVYETSGSYSRLGLITMASMLPWVPLAPLAGVLTDRRDARGVMLWAQVGLAVLNLTVACGLLWNLIGWPEMVAAAVLSGSLRAVENPARQSMARRLVGVETLGNAIGLNAAAFQCTQALGYALAGGIYALGGASACFFAVSAFTLPMVVQLARLEGVAPVARTNGQRAWNDLVEGFRYAFTHAVTRAAVLGAGGVILLLISFRTLMPAIAKDRLGLGPDGFGVLMALGGVGAFAGALWVAAGVASRHGGPAMMVRIVLLACASVSAVAVGTSVWIVGPALVVVGFCQVAFLAGSNATIQQTVPDALRGRVMGIWALVFGASFPLGGWLLSEYAEWVGMREAILTGVGAALLVLLYLRWRVGRRPGGPSRPSAPLPFPVQGPAPVAP